jgi:hypothetical protein
MRNQSNLRRKAAANPSLKAPLDLPVLELLQRQPMAEISITADEEVETAMFPAKVKVAEVAESHQRGQLNSNKPPKPLYLLARPKLSEFAMSPVDGAEPKANVFLRQQSELAALTASPTRILRRKASATSSKPLWEVLLLIASSTVQGKTSKKAMMANLLEVPRDHALEQVVPVQELALHPEVVMAAAAVLLALLLLWLPLV